MYLICYCTDLPVISSQYKCSDLPIFNLFPTHTVTVEMVPIEGPKYGSIFRDHILDPVFNILVP